MERSGFEVNGDELVDCLWFLFEDHLYVLELSSFDVIEEVFVPGVGVGNALYHPHFELYIQYYYEGSLNIYSIVYLCY